MPLPTTLPMPQPRHLSGQHARALPGSRTFRKGLVALSLLAMTGCITERNVRPVNDPPPIAWETSPDAAWSVEKLDQAAGYVVRYSSGGEDVHYFSVRNLDHQELGMLDSHGRAWRFAPHAREATFLGSGTASEGAARILGLDNSIRLEPISLSELSAQAELDRARD